MLSKQAHLHVCCLHGIQQVVQQGLPCSFCKEVELVQHEDNCLVGPVTASKPFSLLSAWMLLQPSRPAHTSACENSKPITRIWLGVTEQNAPDCLLAGILQMLMIPRGQAQAGLPEPGVDMMPAPTRQVMAQRSSLRVSFSRTI